MRQTTWREGVRAGLPYALAGFLLSMSFGVLARNAGFSEVQTIIASIIIYAGSAQFAMLAIVASGGGLAPAVAAAALVNSRFLPMGIALAPSLPGGPAKRAAQGQPVVDASWVLAGRPDGTFDRPMLFWSSAIQYLTWQTGTIVGAFGDELLGDPEKLGLDAIFPAFFLALLIAELKEGRGRLVTLVGGLIAMALVPFTPVGVPVLAASVAAFLGLRRT
jgi:4-azaleucine resistance transporter AzlC